MSQGRYYSDRQTGRTTRMIEEAKRLADEGRAVYIVTANHGELHRIERLVDGHPRIKVETPETMDPFDWGLLRCRGMHDNCEVLVDHFAIESMWSRTLDMLHRFDIQEEKE